MEKQMIVRIAKHVGIPMNPEIYELQKWKKWEQLSLEEMAIVLESYGVWIREQIFQTNFDVHTKTAYAKRLLRNLLEESRLVKSVKE